MARDPRKCRKQLSLGNGRYVPPLRFLVSSARPRVGSPVHPYLSLPVFTSMSVCLSCISVISRRVLIYLPVPPTDNRYLYSPSTALACQILIPVCCKLLHARSSICLSLSFFLTRSFSGGLYVYIFLSVSLSVCLFSCLHVFLSVCSRKM